MFKDNVFAAFKNYKTLRKKQSNCQPKVLHTNRKKEYIRDLNDYFNENSITHKVTASYLPEQNKKTERVNHIIMSLIWAIFA